MCGFVGRGGSLDWSVQSIRVSSSESTTEGPVDDSETTVGMLSVFNDRALSWLSEQQMRPSLVTSLLSLLVSGRRRVGGGGRVGRTGHDASQVVSEQ